MTDKQRTIAVFDFDGTITDRDSFGSFVKAVKGTPRFCLGICMQMPRLVGYKLGIIRNDKAKEALFGTYFRGMGMNEFRRAGERFADSIDRRLRPDTMTKLNWHLSMGHDVYIVTASMPQWIRPWATAYGISDVIGTEPETDSSGVLTGRFATPNCYGPEKVRRFIQAEPNRSSYRLIAYGDSEGDREMLDEADESHLV